MTVLAAGFESPRSPAQDFAGARLAAFAAATAIACGLQRGSYAETGSGHALLTIVALAAIAIAIWHGAYDGVLARPLFAPRLGKWWVPGFAGSYLLLVAATLAAWWVAPGWALAAFLAYSSWHFGTERDAAASTAGGALCGLALGALPIAAACRWHPAEVNAIFEAMLGFGRGAAGDRLFAQQLTHAGAWLLWGIVAVAAAGASLGLLGAAPAIRRSGRWSGRRSGRRSGRWTVLGLVAAELILFRICDPVLAFAVFFCLWHTPEHLVGTSLDRAGRYSPRIMLRNLRAGILPWVASLAGLAMLAALRRGSVVGYESAIFVFLSALTVPHMALNEMRRFRRPA